MTFGSAQPQLTVRIINDFVLPVPPLPEQRRIAEILSTWDRAIATVEKLIANARAQKSALMQRLLIGANVRLSGFKGAWSSAPLGKLARIRKGEQKNRASLASTGAIPVINGGITPSGYTNEPNTPAHTITISEGGNSCGFVGLIDRPFWSGGHCYALLDLAADRDYLFAYLKHAESRIMSLRVGSGLPNIQKKDLASLIVPLPEKSEQQAIGRMARTSDAELRALECDLASLRQEKAALMQQLLTGKRRVKIDASTNALVEAAA